MPTNRVFNLTGLNLGLNPMLLKEGEFIRLHNMENDVAGGKKKRPGYATYLGTANGSAIDSLWNWTQNDGTTFWNYRASGGIVYYSTQGTGAWTVCGNGTMTAGTPVFNAVLENTMLICDGGSATRHTTNGTSFTNTTSAPIARGMVDYQSRIYAIGTGNSLIYSNVGTPTDWTNDSTSLNLPGAGRPQAIFKSNDRVVTALNSGLIHRFDGYNLIDMATNLGPSSPVSLGTIEDFRLWLNRDGIMAYNGNRPVVISNSIEKLIYNDAGEGIAGTTFDTAPGIAHQYDYYLSVGTVTDDLTDETISDAIIKYDYQLNEFSTYSFANRPNSWLPYRDTNRAQQLVFGAGSQCYTYGGTVVDDSGSTIGAAMEFVVHAGAPETEKEWKNCWFFFNPGNQAKVQVAPANTFTKGKKNWIGLGDCSNGIAEFQGQGLRSNLLFVKITEASRASRFHFYGFAYSYDSVGR